MKAGSLISYFEDTDSQPCALPRESVCVFVCVGVCGRCGAWTYRKRMSEERRTCRFKCCKCLDNYSKQMSFTAMHSDLF